MSWIEAVVLGLVQGLTEFIPISSSGHLLLLRDAFGLSEDGLVFDVALHIGTLLALGLFFYKDIVKLFKSLFRKTEQTRLAWLIAMATIPAVIAGSLLQGVVESTLRATWLVAINLIVVGALMLWADRRADSKKVEITKLSRRQALVIGLAQAAAIVPGVSRSGSTITAGLFSGLDRVTATRFSFLLAIPITAGAILKVLLSDEALTSIGENTGIFVVGMLTAFVSGLLAIKFLLAYLSRRSLSVFAYYRILLGFGVIMALLLH